ncbi:MAG: carboxymuconolactone decarboxylase family protein, partial [Porphyrobacter sp.]|nr:carboxymuconolactone decarboxylase family protein [Porphyrobacter sp.]
LTVAKANRCDYCASAHSAISASMKVGQEEILANLNGTSGNPRLAAILALASRIVAEKGHLTDADLADARAAGLDDGDIIEVTANVVANIFTNYINHIAQTDIDFPVVATAA